MDIHCTDFVSVAILLNKIQCNSSIIIRTLQLVSWQSLAARVELGGRKGYDHCANGPCMHRLAFPPSLCFNFLDSSLRIPHHY